MVNINPLLFGVVLFCPLNDIYAVTLAQFNPGTNDDLMGVFNVLGTRESLTGNQRFVTGVDGSVNTTLGSVTVISGAQFINRARLEPGPQNYAITVPDTITGGNTVFQVYNSASLVALPAINNATVVPDIRNVNDNQYINTRVANISNGGTLNVSIGSGTASSTADTHAWIMAAKQSALFNVDGNSATASTLNWNNNNRISFIGSAATPTSGTQAQASYIVQDVANFKGAFSVQTLNGSSTSFNVTSATELKAYNDWLIDQLQAGNLDKARYLSEFNKAFSRSNENIVYLVSATVPDEATLPTGSVVAINADGPNAVVNVAAGRTLEVAGATRGAIHAMNGAQVNIDGKLSSQGDDFNGITNSAALWLDASSADNNGVINGGFLNRATASNDGVGQTSYNANGIQLLNGSDFTNNGVVNFATTGSTTTNTSGVAAINLGVNARADNAGNLNVGVNGSSASGTTSGVLLSSSSASFTNTADGVIYLGRGPQNSKGEAAADTAINQSGLTSGIALLQGGRAINYGHIVTGSRVQNSAAMFASGSPTVMLNNSGVIDINGQAASVPRENIAISVLNAGSAGGIINAGTLNLNGVNGTGLKVVATGANSARAASTGVINVAGGADAASGTRNYGVWAEGQGTGSASATIDGAVNLIGNGAIGVHARGRALVQVTDDAVPTFRNGSNQIGFFAWGENADIQVANSRPLTVATSGSTLFRLEQGADLSTTSMTLNSAGAGSVGVLGTGSGSDIVMQSSHFSVSGAGASGLQIEGGATGIIDAATTLDLSGTQATGAIVDGQKHSLDGTASGTPLAGTQLASAATISSIQDSLTGYLARNSARLTHSGVINFSGAASTGIAVESGATADNSGTITINNGGTAIRVNGSTQTTTASNSAALTVNGGSVSARSRGVSASGSAAVAHLNAGALTLNGAGAIGAEALKGAQITVAATAQPQFHNSDQLAYHVAGAGSAISAASNTLDISTLRSTGYRLDDGATLNLSGATHITASAEQSSGIIASGVNSQLNSGATSFAVTGDSSNALRVEGGATADLPATTTLALQGDGSTGVIVDNLRTDLSNALNGEAAPTRVTSNAQVMGSGDHALGFAVANGASLSRAGVLQLQGDDSTALRIRTGGVISNNGEVNVASGTGLEVLDAGDAQLQGGRITVADGIAGVRVGNNGQLTLRDAAISSAGTANGVLLDDRADSLALSNSSITVIGSGDGLNNRAATSHVALNNVTIATGDGDGIRTGVAFDDPEPSATLTVQGHGIAFDFTQADDSPAEADLLLGAGYHINVTGAGGTGIRANTTGTVENLASVAIDNASGGSALVSDTARQLLNLGTLQSRSLSAPVVALSGSATVLENRGDILAADPTLPAITTAAGDDQVVLSAGAVVGDVQTGAGSDTVQWRGGSLNGGLALGAGENNQALVQAVDLSNTRHITSGTDGGNRLTLAQVAGRGGSFADGDDTAKGTNLGSGWSTINFVDSQWVLTDDLQLAQSDVNIDTGSTLLAGNNVHPLMAANVHNAGIIDLTNGSGSPGNTLTIDGDLTSDAGQIRLLTRLNEGGALANQFSDKLWVNGNASNGVTLLNVTPDSLSNGSLTDSDHSGQVDADEGISLVQVSGNAQAQSFALSGGYLAAGPWQYQLYPFAPGSSDASQRQVAGGSDNQYWDYRLGNLYVCEANCPVYAPPPVNPPPGNPAPGNPTPENPAPTNPSPAAAPVARPAVIPQVPSYLSAPVGLAYYTAAIIDDLHKRLGELRDRQMAVRDTEGELFLRYIGSNLRYKSDLSFTDFGYNLDIDYSAMQLGGNIVQWDGASSALRGGVAWTRGNTRLRPHAADGLSATTFDSDSIALYSTWLHHSGFYIDGALSVDWHRGETDIGRQQRVGKLKGRGWSASLETGYPFILAHGIRLEPQAQLLHMRLNMDDFTDRDGTRVQYGHDSQTIGRLGLRLDRSWTDNAGRQYTPWLRVNYYQGWGGGAKTRVSAQDNSNLQHTFDGGRFGQSGELGAGGTVSFKNNLALYAEADYRRQIDNNGARGWRYNIGVRWQF